MATKKEGLPEISVNEGDIIVSAREATTARSKAVLYTSIEKTHTEKIGILAEERRKEEVTRGKFIGVLRVTAEELPPVRVEFRMENGTLNIEEEKNLNDIYGPTRPLLFQREKVVTEIIDPTTLIKELIDAGKNPWDYLDLKVKKDMDHAVVESKCVVSAEAFFPKEGFLNTVNEVKNTMSEDAVMYTTTYLDNCLKPRVVLGTAKGK